MLFFFSYFQNYIIFTPIYGAILQLHLSFNKFYLLFINFNNSALIEAHNSSLPTISIFSTFLIVISLVLLVVFLLVAVAFFTLAERKVMGAIQRRSGPNIVGFLGLLQPVADGLKLIIKEIIIPKRANAMLFLLAPYLAFVLSVIGWSVIPFGPGNVISDINLSVIYIFAVSSLGAYSIIMAGYSSHSRYSFLGSLRAAAQMVSYEVALGFVIICIAICSGSLSLTSIVLAQTEVQGIWYFIPLYPMFIIFFISLLAETNRAPFDLPESESELVSGYNTEYSSITFALFFLGEYSNILLMCALTTILFFGGWSLPLYFPIPCEFFFAIKVVIGAFFFILVRAVLPRYRYDRLMEIGWKVFLPFTLGYLIFLASIFIIFQGTPFIEEVSIYSQLYIYKYLVSLDYSIFLFI